MLLVIPEPRTVVVPPMTVENRADFLLENFSEEVFREVRARFCGACIRPRPRLTGPPPATQELMSSDLYVTRPSLEEGAMEQKQERTEVQRANDRERKRRSRENIAAKEHDQELEELRLRDPEGAHIRELWTEVMAKPITRPGVPIPDTDPEVVRVRNEKFEREKAEGERKSLATSRFLLFLCAQGIPFSLGLAYFPDGLPLDKKGT